MFLRWILGDPLASGEEQLVALRFSRQLWGYFEQQRLVYLKRFGNVLNTDNAKELCAIYAANSETRARYSSCIYAPAKRFIMKLFEREIGSKDIATLILLSGGAASGKSVLHPFIKRIKRPLVLDGTLSKYSDAREQIRLALACDKQILVIHVFCPFEAAVHAALRRALDSGRTISLDALAETHFYAQETFLRLASCYRDSGEGVRFSLVDNSVYERPEMKELDFLKSNAHTHLKSLKLKAHETFESACVAYKEETGEELPFHIRHGFARAGRKVG